MKQIKNKKLKYVYVFGVWMLRCNEIKWKALVIQSRYRGVVAIRVGTRISHLLFSNDCIIFYTATMKEWLMLQRLLNTYAATSSQ